MSNTGSMATQTPPPGLEFKSPDSTGAVHPNGPAPTRSPGQNKSGTFTLGGKGGKGALAWQHIWDQLSRTEWRNGAALAEDAAARFGLKKVSVVELLSRMRASGVIEQKMIPVETHYGRGKGYVARRPRVHYRININEWREPADANR